MCYKRYHKRHSSYTHCSKCRPSPCGEHLAGSPTMIHQEVSMCWTCWAIVLIRLGISETLSRLEPLARGNPTKARPRIPSDYHCQGRNQLTVTACLVCGAMAIWAPAGWDSKFQDGQDRLAHVVLPLSARFLLFKGPPRGTDHLSNLVEQQ